ncbi:MAG: HAMP domain-containing protein [bacterium]|nr:HAMP domain-containing protein [bacterium]
MSLNRPAPSPSSWLTMLMLLTLPFTAGVESASAQADPTEQTNSSEMMLIAEAQRVEGLLNEAVLGMRQRGLAIDIAWRHVGESGDTEVASSAAAFSFLESVLGPELEIMDLPLGAQLIRDDELLAWTGWPVPWDGQGDWGASADAGFALRSFGVYQFLSLRGHLSGDESITWILDLPLTCRADLLPGEGGLPVLLSPGRNITLEVIPPLTPAAPERPVDTRSTALHPLDPAVSTTDEGEGKCWAFAPLGHHVFELRLFGPTDRTLALNQSLRKSGTLGLLFMIITMVVGLTLRRLLVRRFPKGMPLVLRALFISTFIICLRLILAWAGIAKIYLGDLDFWSPLFFSITGFGDLFGNPGEFLITSLAALVVLLLVLRPYLRPDARFDDRSEQSAARRRFRPGDLPLLVVGILLPCLAVLSACNFARAIFENTGSRMLFETRLMEPSAIGFNVALFFGLSFLIALFLVPATSVWKRLPVSRTLRLSAGLIMLVAVGLLGDLFAACALALLLPITWKMRRTTTRFTGLVYHLFFIVISVALLSEGTLGRVRDAHLHQFLADVATDDGVVDLWRPVMMEEILVDIGRNEELRRSLAKSTDLEPGMALTLWRRSGLQELGLEGGLEIYDSLGRLQDSFQWGIDLPPQPMRPTFKRESPDLWWDVEQNQVLRGDDDRPTLEGRILLRDSHDLLGSVELILADCNLVPALRLQSPPWRERSPLERRIAIPGEEEIFLAQLDGEGQVVYSSAPTLVPEGAVPATVEEGVWDHRNLKGRSFNVSGFGDKLVGYAENSWLERLLESALRLFIYLIILLILFVLDIIFSRTGFVRRYLPPLIGIQGFGFQHRLLGAFLLVALVPTILTGLIANRQLRSQYDEATLRTSLERVMAARYSLENMVRQDAQKLLRSEYVQNFITQEFQAIARDTGSYEENQIMIFNHADSLILDESLRNWSKSDVDSFLAVVPLDQVVYERSGSRLFAGILLPLEISTRRIHSINTIYYRQLLGDEILRNMTDIIGGDLSLFSGGTLLRSNQPFLYGLGYSTPMLDPGAVNDLLLADLPFRQDLHQAGDMSFGQASLALHDAADHPVAVLSSLDFTGLTSRRDAQERGESVVLSMISLLVILALGLGGFLAGRVFLPIRRLHLGTRRLADGDLSYRLQPLGRDEIGDLVRSFNTMASGLQETRKELEERQRHLEGVLENVASGVMILGLAGEVRSVNNAGRRLLGVAANDLDNCNLSELDRATEWPGVKAGPLFRLLLDNPPQLATGGRELRLEHSEGERDFRVASSELPTGRVVVFEDVTEMIRSQKLAAWSEMARQVAHEIKNPLTPIKLSTQFMERAWRDRRPNFEIIFKESIEIIKEQVEILRRRASEFSLFGRRPGIRLETMDLVAATREVLAPYATETLELNWEGDDGVPVLADPEALRKVLLNLVENAREAMGGKGQLDCVCRVTEEGGQLLVRDHGTGIPEETLGRLFEPYFSTKTGGTGLGLAISAQAVEEMGGTLSLENHPDGGAVAHLLLRNPGDDGTLEGR